MPIHCYPRAGSNQRIRTESRGPPSFLLSITGEIGSMKLCFCFVVFFSEQRRASIFPARAVRSRDSVQMESSKARVQNTALPRTEDEREKALLKNTSCALATVRCRLPV